MILILKSKSCPSLHASPSTSGNRLVLSMCNSLALSVLYSPYLFNLFLIMVRWKLWRVCMVSEVSLRLLWRYLASRCRVHPPRSGVVVAHQIYAGSLHLRGSRPLLMGLFQVCLFQIVADFFITILSNKKLLNFFGGEAWDGPLNDLMLIFLLFSEEIIIKIFLILINCVLIAPCFVSFSENLFRMLKLLVTCIFQILLDCKK